VKSEGPTDTSTEQIPRSESVTFSAPVQGGAEHSISLPLIKVAGTLTFAKRHARNDDGIKPSPRTVTTESPVEAMNDGITDATVGARITVKPTEFPENMRPLRVTEMVNDPGANDGGAQSISDDETNEAGVVDVELSRVRKNTHARFGFGTNSDPNRRVRMPPCSDTTDGCAFRIDAASVALSRSVEATRC